MRSADPSRIADSASPTDGLARGDEVRRLNLMLGGLSRVVGVTTSVVASVVAVLAIIVLVVWLLVQAVTG